MKVKIEELKKLTLKSLKNYGYDTKESKVISDILLYAQLRGNNQGVVKLIGAGIPKRKDAKLPKVVKSYPATALIDGNKTHAMIVMNMETEMAIDKAKKMGVGIVGNFNTSESTGALGYYVKKIADKGLIGIAFASAPFKTTAPFGSTEALFCTNPMAFGIPTDKDPIIHDMSTSAIAYYGLIEANTAGKKVDEGVGYDEKGNPTTNPAKIMSGAIKTFAGHKGSGLAFVVQVLASALVNAEYFNSDSDNAGNLVIAINPVFFVSRSSFKEDVSKMTKRIKGSRKLKGVKEIYVPGERGNTLFKNAVKSGFVEIEPNLYKGLQVAAGVK